MSEQLRESLSAAMDDEADAFELRRVLDESRGDDALRSEWHRWHLIRGHLRADPSAADAALRERVLTGLLEGPEDDEREPMQLVEPRPARERTGQRWLGRLAGTAVAAAVAVIVVVNGDRLLPDDTPEIAEAIPALGTPVGVAATPVMYDVATENDRRRLDALRMLHYQHNALNTAGAVSFVRMATFDRTRARQVVQQPGQ